MRTATRDKPATPAEVRAALQAMQRACKPTALEIAQSAMLAAKRRITTASIAAIAGDERAPELTEIALEALASARAALRKLDDANG